MLEEVVVTANALEISGSGPQQSYTRRPRALVQVNDNLIPGWISWTAESNRFYQADTFRVDFAMSSLPAEFNKRWFTQQKEMFVEIFAGFPSDPVSFDRSELDSIIYGRADHVEINLTGGTLTLPGRDLTAVFIDAKTSVQYQNQTAIMNFILFILKINMQNT